jgi:hypothetical protein
MSRTFDEAFSEHRLTPAERSALVWHLAEFRARKTVEALLPETKPDFDPRDYGLRSAPTEVHPQGSDE